ncbi:MAG: hypothetical protein ABIR94_15940 [Rubrivivax sp.]
MSELVQGAPGSSALRRRSNVTNLRREASHRGNVELTRRARQMMQALQPSVLLIHGRYDIVGKPQLFAKPDDGFGSEIAEVVSRASADRRQPVRRATQ